MSSPVKIILTGATGMVGEGVMHECLLSDAVTQVLIINRRPTGFEHPKLKEIIHENFNDLTPIADQLAGYDACLFCAGVSSIGKKEAEYSELTYTLTLNFAKAVSKNPSMIFCYISGAGTDANGRMMWARVKGKTENDLKKLPFKKVYNFRPGILYPTKGLKNTLSAYKYFGWLIPLIKLLTPNSGTTLAELGKAMIHAVTKGYDTQTIEVKDIKILAKE